MLIDNIKFNNPQEVLTILRDFDNEFNPQFSLSVNLSQYAEKLAIHSQMIRLSEDDKIIGCCFYYENTDKSDIYIPYICLKSAFRGRCYSALIIDFIVKKYIGKYTTISLEVRTNNESAIRFYKNNGFRIISTSSTNNKYLMQKEII